VRLADQFVSEAFEVFGLGDHGDDGVVGGLGVGGDAAEDFVGVEGGGEDGVLEKAGIDVVRAAEGREGAARFQQLQRAEMNFLVPAQGIRHGGAIARERGRVEDDEVEFRDELFGGRGFCLCFKPVENIGGFKGALVGEAVGFGVAFGGGDGIGALIEQMDVGCAGAGGVQAEAAEEAEAIEHLGTFREVRHGFVVGLLIQVKTGFVAGDQIGFEFEAVEIGGDGATEFAGEDAAGFGEAFKFARGDFAAFKDGARRKNLLERGDDLRFPLIHAEGGNLDDEHVFVFVDNEAAKKITFGVDDAGGGGVRQMVLAHGECFADALFEEGFVDIRAIRRQDADVDFGFGIEKADAEQALAMVLDLGEFAVTGLGGHAED